MPARQAKQLAFVGAPRVVENVPAMHSWQLLVPTPVLKVPAGHEGQTVLLTLVHAADWKVPAEQVLQLKHQTWSVLSRTSVKTPRGPARPPFPHQQLDPVSSYVAQPYIHMKDQYQM